MRNSCCFQRAIIPTRTGEIHLQHLKLRNLVYLVSVLSSNSAEGEISVVIDW
jgi:hypothetical protein